jgi:hypothetical protein
LSEINIEIRPDVNILGVLRNLNYKPWFALAEFVDNAVQSFLEHRSSDDILEVSIQLQTAGGGRIVITDNAYGISREDFPRAFRAAEVPPNRAGLSEFGMGMKSAATWFAQKWSVRTSVADEAVQRVVEFDMSDITSRRLDVLPVQELPAHAADHFTIVTLENLNQLPRGRAVEKIKNHLTSIYRMFLRDGDVRITYNGDKLEYQEVEVLKAPPSSDTGRSSVRWIQDVDLRLDETHKVEGFVGIRAKGSTRTAGLALFRRRRLIVGSDDETYRPEAIFRGSNSFEHQRIFGELRLTGFDVSYTKDGIQWGQYEDIFLDELIKSLRDGDHDLLSQARNYRATEIQATQRSEIQKGAQSAAIELAQRLAAVSDTDGTSSAAGEPSQPEPEVLSVNSVASHDEAVLSVEARITTANRIWRVTINASTDPSVAEWLRVDDSEEEVWDAVANRPSTRVTLSVAMAHPFSLRYIGALGEASQTVLAFAGAIGSAYVMSKQAGVKVSIFLHHLNKMLGQPIELEDAK